MWQDLGTGTSDSPICGGHEANTGCERARSISGTTLCPSCSRRSRRGPAAGTGAACSRLPVVRSAAFSMELMFTFCMAARILAFSRFGTRPKRTAVEAENMDRQTLARRSQRLWWLWRPGTELASCLCHCAKYAAVHCQCRAHCQGLVALMLPAPALSQNTQLDYCCTNKRGERVYALTVATHADCDALLEPAVLAAVPVDPQDRTLLVLRARPVLRSSAGCCAGRSPAEEQSR